MKKIFLVFLMIMATIPCSAQWKNGSMGAQVLAFGVHDTSFFIGINPAGTQAPLIWRLRSVTPNVVWVIADTNIDHSQGNITSFASLGNYFFAGQTFSDGTEAGSYRSINNGSEWETSGGSPVYSNGNYVFSSSTTTVYRSRDSGNTWVAVACPNVNSFSSIGTCILASNVNGVWRSLDTGTNWTQVSSKYAGTITVMGTLLFIAGNGKLAESTDSGSDWTQVAVDSVGVPENVTCLATDGKNLFAGTPMGVLVSTDTGRDWKAENDSLTYKDISAIGVFDTLLFIDVSNIGPSSEFAAYYRPIHEMVKPDSPVSVAQTPRHDDSISIYPNPASGIVTILSGGTSIYGVSVLNVLGENVLDVPNLRNSELTLDISQIPSGTYFFLIKTDGGSITRRVVVIK